MIDVLFIIISFVVTFFVILFSKLTVKIISRIGKNNKISKSPLLRNALFKIIIGILSFSFLIGISFPFLSRVGFNFDNIQLSFVVVGLFFAFMLVAFLFIFLVLRHNKKGYSIFIRSSFEEDFFDLELNNLQTPNKILWLLYRWLISGIMIEVLFRGLVMGILDIFEEHYFDLTIIKLPLTVLIAQIIYHLFYIRLSFKPFRIVIYPFEQICILFVGLTSGLLFWYTQSLFGSFLIGSLYSGLSATFYILSLKNK
jgi:hypothetical protein